MSNAKAKQSHYVVIDVIVDGRVKYIRRPLFSNIFDTAGTFILALKELDFVKKNYPGSVAYIDRVCAKF